MKHRIITLSNVLKTMYYVAIFLLTIRYVIGSSYLNNSSLSIFTYTSWILLIIDSIFVIRSFKYYLLLSICMVIAINVYKSADSLLVFTFILKIFGGISIEEKNAIKASYISLITGTIIVVFSSIVGIIPKTTLSGDMALGFTNINTLAHFVILILVMHLSYKKMNVTQYMFWVVFDIILFYFTKSRTSSLLFLIIIFLKLISSKIKHRKILLYFCLGIIFAVSAGLITMTINYDKRTMGELNTLLSGRIYQGNYYYEKYGIKVFGSYIPELMSSKWHNLLDQGYLALLIKNGLIFGIIFIFYLYFVIYKKIKQDDLSAIILLFYVAATLITENVFVDANLNPVCIYITSFIMTKYEKRKREKLEYDTQNNTLLLVRR